MAHVLVIGSGGREHTIAWKISQSNKVGKVTVAPGNPGTSSNGGQKSKLCQASDFPGLSDFNALSQWCEGTGVDFVVVGPEDPLANGITDHFLQRGMPCFGPSRDAAQIEASKIFSKNFMSTYSIPTASWDSFSDPESAKRYILSLPSKRCVVKADGLAAGKGVVVAQTTKQAFEAVDDIMVIKKYGKTCGDSVIVEELLEGFEVSCLCFTDGNTVKCMPLSQDHKKLFEGDTGPNTGGMGAYAPCPLVDERTRDEIHGIMNSTVAGMREAGCPFTGVLYGGFMITRGGPKVLEFNCRFGDPETQVLLPLLQSDLYDVMTSCCAGTLKSQKVMFDCDRSCVAIVLASGGYPEKYRKGCAITGIDALSSDMRVFHAGTTYDGSNELVTSGGRVLAVVSVEYTLEQAASRALEAAASIQFTGAYYRKDIAHAALKPAGGSTGLTYADAGVDIKAGESLVRSIKPLCKDTEIAGCAGNLGMFGSVFDLKLAGLKDPLLISGTDGVGTKLLIALECKAHANIGQDLVAMCVNDILCHGARPLYFLDYFATGKLDSRVAEEVIAGIASACKKAGCALVGGETAEMPDVYPSGKYDLAGFAVGAVERGSYLPRVDDIRSGDVIIGLPSSGFHSNGFSLIRRVISDSGLSYSDVCPFDESKTIGELLLTPTEIYVDRVLQTLTSGQVKAVSHITGGGLLENIPRVLPSGVKVHLDARRWNIPPAFGWIQFLGDVSSEEMSKTFNCGLGLVMIVNQSDVTSVCSATGGQVVGEVVARVADESQVNIDNLSEALQGASSASRGRKRVAVLISGTGTNLQALIDSCQLSSSNANIVLVVSNVEGVQGLERASKAGIPTSVISHKGFKSREEFDSEITAALEEVGAEIVCLAGFMRILSGRFVKRWTGCLINVHPSLLPSFKGMDAHSQALKAGVKLSGCTVHFVEEEIDSGEILEQEAVPVLPGDTISSLQERVKCAEHKAFPRALQNLANKLLSEEK